MGLLERRKAGRPALHLAHLGAAEGRQFRSQQVGGPGGRSDEYAVRFQG